MNKRILNAEARFERAKEHLAEVIEEVQTQCKHPVECVHEVSHRRCDYTAHDPPFRFCQPERFPLYTALARITGPDQRIFR